MSDSQDSSTAAAPNAGVPQPLVSVTVNTNSNNDNGDSKFVTTASLYVATVLSDVPKSSPYDGEGEHSSKHEEQEGGDGERKMAETQEKQNETGRVEIILHNPANSTLNDSDIISSSTANPMPNVQPSDLL